MNSKSLTFTRTPNAILDLLPEMDRSELKLTMLLVRLTFGYSENGRHREEVKLTFDDMCEALSAARGTVNRAVQLVEDRGFFRRGRRSTWVLDKKFSLNYAPNKLDDSAEIRLNSGTEIVQKLDQNSLKTELNQLDDSAEIRPFQSYKEKEKEKKVERETDPHFFSSEWFQLNGVPGPEGDEEWALLKHPATAVWLDVVGRWPTYPGLRQITKRLGVAPNRETLRDVWDIWTASGYNLSNIAGVLDRYERAMVPNGRASPAPAVPVLVEIEEGSGLY